MSVRLCPADEVDEGCMVQAKVEGHPPFAVYRVEGQIHVTDDTCTHGKASLADEGELEGHCVTCTWHDGRFDIRTGQPLCAPCTHPIRVYPVRVDGGDVWVDID
jgi:nitrite reductase/ring-hydroxylating ferredoxin subunit